MEGADPSPGPRSAGSARTRWEKSAMARWNSDVPRARRDIVAWVARRSDALSRQGLRAHLQRRWPAAEKEPGSTTLGRCPTGSAWLIYEPRILRHSTRRLRSWHSGSAARVPGSVVA